MNEAAPDAGDGGGMPNIASSVEEGEVEGVLTEPDDAGFEGSGNAGEAEEVADPGLHEFATYMESAESLAEYRRAMGIPDHVDDYEVSLGEGETLVEQDLAFLKKAGVEYGIAPSAMSALARDYLAAHSDARAAVDAEYEAGFKDLAQEWGADYDARIADAKLTAGKVCAMAGVDMNVLRETEFGASAEAFKLFSYIGGLIKEGKAKGVAQAEVTSGETEARRIESDPSHPLHEAYMDYKHSNHQYANEVYDRCMGIGR